MKSKSYPSAFGLCLGLCFCQAYTSSNVIIMIICLILFIWYSTTLIKSILSINKKKPDLLPEAKPKEDQCTRIMPYGKRCERTSRGYGHRGWCNTCEDSRYGY